MSQPTQSDEAQSAENRSQDKPAVVDSLCARFGCEFTVWIHSGDWCCLDAVSPESELLDRAELTRLFEDCLRTSECGFRELSAGRVLLTVPVADEETTQAVAVGIINPRPAELAARLADSVLSEVAHTCRATELERDIDQFAEQFSANLEELSWVRQLAAKLGCKRVTQTMIELATQALPALRSILDAESLILVTPDASRPQPEAEIDRYAFPAWDSDSLPDQALWRRFMAYAAEFAQDQAYVINAHCDFRGSADTDAVQKQCPQIHSAILVEIADGKTTFGWLLALNKGGAAPEHATVNGTAERLGLDEFGTHEATLLESGARMLAAHASNVSLFNEQRDLVVNVVRSMINVIDARDPYTCGHSDRVAVISKLLARKLGLPLKDQEAIYLSGLLHDIGKVGVPDDVLLKPGRLTEDEFRQIKEHPERGVKILQHLKQLQHVLPGVLHHHEAFDGSGYPHGLVGEEIPLMARIMAVADAYDAMTTNRPYRVARSVDEAESILRRGAGMQWDPLIVATFVDALEEVQEVAHQWETHVAEVLNPSGRSYDDAGTPTTDSVLTAVAATHN